MCTVLSPLLFSLCISFFLKYDSKVCWLYRLCGMIGVGKEYSSSKLTKFKFLSNQEGIHFYYWNYPPASFSEVWGRTGDLSESSPSTCPTTHQTWAYTVRHIYNTARYLQHPHSQVIKWLSISCNPVSVKYRWNIKVNIDNCYHYQTASSAFMYIYKCMI